MLRKIPLVRDWMSRLPAELEYQDTVGKAAELMRKGSFRHLPVMDGPRLIGIVSRHDLARVTAAFGDEAASMSLDEVCTKDVLKFAPDSPLDRVARGMLERKVDSAVIQDGGLVIGIFTSTDALRLIAETFQSSGAR